MRVVFAPDSFKGTVTAVDAARTLAEAWRAVDPSAETVLRPMADGGEGTVAAFEAAVPGAIRMPIAVDGPAGARVSTTWLLLPPSDELPGGTAVVDMATTSGIELLDALRPFDADSTGFGQAIVAALDHGVSRLVLGIGSSASTDGGTGMLRALGARFANAAGGEPSLGAAGVLEITSVDMSGLRPAPEVLVLTDVTNPLTGPRGSAAVFGPQKGLTEAPDQRRVDAALGRLANLLGVPTDMPGAGAAGGVGTALVVWGAKLMPGAAEVARLVDLGGALASADVVVTGEGSYDGQSGNGKVPSFVASAARDVGARAAVVAGRIAEDADTSMFEASVSLASFAGSDEAAMVDTTRWMTEAGKHLAGFLSR